jgi:hypothetical protein
MKVEMIDGALTWRGAVTLFMPAVLSDETHAHWLRGG